jgi:hypothetical protein
MPDNKSNSDKTGSIVITIADKDVLVGDYDLDGILNYLVSYIHLTRSYIEGLLIKNGLGLEQAAELVDFARKLDTKEEYERWLEDYLNPARDYISKHLHETLFQALYKLVHEAVAVSLQSVAKQKTEKTFTKLPTEIINIISGFEKEGLKGRLDAPEAGRPPGSLYFNSKADFERKLLEAIKRARDTTGTANQEIVAGEMTNLLPNYTKELDVRTLRGWCKGYYPDKCWKNIVDFLKSQNPEEN